MIICHSRFVDLFQEAARTRQCATEILTLDALIGPAAKPTSASAAHIPEQAAGTAEEVEAAAAAAGANASDVCWSFLTSGTSSAPDPTTTVALVLSEAAGGENSSEVRALADLPLPRDAHGQHSQRGMRKGPTGVLTKHASAVNYVRFHPLFSPLLPEHEQAADELAPEEEEHAGIEGEAEGGVENAGREVERGGKKGNMRVYRGAGAHRGPGRDACGYREGGGACCYRGAGFARPSTSA